MKPLKNHRLRTGPLANGYKHGGATRGKVIPEYRAWAGLRSRCFDKNNHKYPIYGGRGISVCKRWGDFKNFLADMGYKPSPLHSIERKDRNGNYDPSNCIWATQKVQQRNRSTNHILRFKGIKKPMTDFAADYGLRVGTLWNRLNMGWSVYDALTRPIRRKN
jgi:hypothetical protein